MSEESSSIFESTTGMVTFVRIEDEFAAVDAALAHLFEGARLHECGIRSRIDAIKSGARFVTDECGDITHDVLMGAEDVELPTANYVASQMTRNISLVTCFALIERCLKIVDQHYGNKLVRAKPGVGKRKSKIDDMLSAFEEVTKDRIELSVSAQAVLSTERRLRNSFAHGDWDVLEQMAEGDHRNLLSAAAEIFREIEDVYARGA